MVSVILKLINKKSSKIIFLSLIIILFNLSFVIQATSAEESKTELTNPLGTTDLKELIARIITIILGLVGAIALVLFIYGGLVWMTAGGSPDKIKQGKDILSWAILGLVVIFTSYIILNFIFQSLGQATQIE